MLDIELLFKDFVKVHLAYAPPMMTTPTRGN